ncbi:MAG: mechanosensitive ion channel family protein [Ardenticatenaceae bacterium]|nr:mechanosensitive ion channel family protein [Ardenticatenaceae bacterium]
MNQTLDQMKQWLLTHGLAILAILVLCVAAYFLLGLLVRFVTRRVKSLDAKDDTLLDRRADTISDVLYSAGLVVIFVTALVMVLEEIGVPIAPLLASVGVVGLALGLGAQTLVKDVISGLFILLENQYMITDVIEVNGIVGNVEMMTLRATTLRDAAGTLYIVPNGEIRIVANRTRDWSRAIIDVGIAYEADVDRALAALQSIGEEMVADPEIGPLLLEAPQVTGVEGLEEWAVRLRMMVKTKPNQQWDVQRYLRRRIRLEFADRGIDLAFPRQEVALVNMPAGEKNGDS